jgi:hypothetical protein
MMEGRLQGRPSFLTLRRGRRKSAAMTTLDQTLFFRRRASQVPVRDRV